MSDENEAIFDRVILKFLQSLLQFMESIVCLFVSYKD